MTTIRATRSEPQAFAKSKGAAELMIPADILRVDELPLLGSGKTDLVAAAKLARERMAVAEAAVA